MAAAGPVTEMWGAHVVTAAATAVSIQEVCGVVAMAVAPGVGRSCTTVETAAAEAF